MPVSVRYRHSRENQLRSSWKTCTIILIPRPTQLAVGHSLSLQILSIISTSFSWDEQSTSCKVRLIQHKLRELKYLYNLLICGLPTISSRIESIDVDQRDPSGTICNPVNTTIHHPTSIPYAVESLTLELFSLGYPPGFLTRLAERLPNLKSLIIYSQLFSGVSQESKNDAVEFLRLSQNLRALHLLDVFASPTFFSSAAKWLRYNTSDVPGEARRGLMFLEINYTYDHEDIDLMGKIAASEMHNLIAPGLISCSFNISPLEGIPGETSSAGKEGIMSFNESITADIVKALTREESYPRGLKALNITLFTMTIDNLKQVLEKHKNVVIANMTIQLEPGRNIKTDILDILRHSPKLEQLEVVGHPTLPFFVELASPGSKKLEGTFPTIRDMETLSGSLTSFKANILRSTSLGTIELTKKDSGWSSTSRSA